MIKAAEKGLALVSRKAMLIKTKHKLLNLGLVSNVRDLSGIEFIVSGYEKGKYQLSAMIEDKESIYKYECYDNYVVYCKRNEFKLV